MNTEPQRYYAVLDIQEGRFSVRVYPKGPDGVVDFTTCLFETKLPLK